MDKIIWKNPPAPRPSRLAQVQEALLARPGDWALIDSGPLVMFPWWGRLVEDGERFEVRFVRHNPGTIFGPRDVYARARVR